MLYYNKNQINCRPQHVIINIKEFLDGVNRLEVDNDIIMDKTGILREIIDRCDVKSKSKYRLDEFCKKLLTDHCYGEPYKEFTDLLDLIVKYGNILVEQNCLFNLYVDDVFPYKLNKIFMNSALLTRVDIFYEKIKQELRDEQDPYHHNSGHILLY